MTESQKLGTVFLAPAALIVVTFFLLPVVLTGVFGFTNMSTATGITSGSYMVTPSVLKRLKAEGVDEATIDALSTVNYTVNDATLASATAAGVKEAIVTEIADRYGGQSFRRSTDFRTDAEEAAQCSQVDTAAQRPRGAF